MENDLNINKASKLLSAAMLGVEAYVVEVMKAKKTQLKPVTNVIIYSFILIINLSVASSLSGQSIPNPAYADITYRSIDYENPIFSIYEDSIFATTISEFDADSLLRFSSINPKLRKSNWSNKLISRRGEYIKRTFRHVISDQVAVSIAGLYVEDTIHQSHYQSDIILWSKIENIWKPIAIYPDALGGCLYCRVADMQIVGDTLKIIHRSRDDGDYSIIEIEFIINDKELIPHMRKYIKGSFPAEGPQYGNPVSGASNKRITIETFDQKNDEPTLSYSFEAKRADGSEIYFKSANDSLVLYLPDVKRYGRRDPRSKPVETIYMGDDSIMVGPMGGGYIAVYWNSKWYKTTMDQVIKRER